LITYRMVGSFIIENKNFLRNLVRTKSEKKRAQMIHEATTDQLLAIAETALNVLKGRLPLTSKQRERLVPYANFVRKLARSRRENSARNVIQVGGGPLLASLITPVLIEIGRALLDGK
jgi:hypothetical protein